MAKNKREIFNSWKSAIKKDLKILVQKSGFDLDTLQKQLQVFIKKADGMIAENDIEQIVKKLKGEHAKLIKMVDRAVKEEVKKANKLLLEKKEKLKKIQKQLEREFSIISSKGKPKKSTRKKTSRKKISKKKASRKTTSRKKTSRKIKKKVS